MNMDIPAAAAADTDERIHGENRWVAAIMVDLAGSTAMTERLGAERAYALFRDILRQSVTAIEDEGGHFVDSAGDSVFAIFGAPVAIENAALAACRAALGIQTRLAQQAKRFEATYGTVPQSRIGIAGGSVLVAQLQISGPGKINALGTAVNLAARLQTLASPGEIVCSEAINAEVRGYARTEPMGSRAIKGLGTPQEVFRLVALEQGTSTLQGRMARGGGAYVGRDSLCAQLAAWLQRAPADPPALVVTGPPGIGKSRLVQQVLPDLPTDMTPVFVHCTPADETAPLQPVLRLLRAAAETGAAQADKGIAAWLDALLGPDETPLPALQDLVRPDLTSPAVHFPDGAGAVAFDLRHQILRAVAAIAARPGLCLIVEDAHWLDPLSREMLALAIDAKGASAPRLLLTSRQPMPMPINPRLGAILTVPPLAPDETIALCTRLLPEMPEADRDRAARIILEQSEGNPLFAEELTRHFMSTGDIDALQAGSAGDIGLIQGLVFSRFDTLGAVEKAALKQAALIGREIRPAYLGALAADGPGAGDILQLAAGHGLVEKDAAGGWRFSHVLVQGSIANSILDAEAATLHRSAADILIAEGFDPSGSRPARVAHHLEMAGLPGHAAPHHLAAAEPAWRVYALDVCQHHLMAAAAQLGADVNRDNADLAAAVVTRLVRVLDIAGNWTALARVADAHLARLSALPDPRPAIIVLTLRAKAANQAADFANANILIEQAMQAANETGDAAVIAIVQTCKMDIVNDRPDFRPQELLDLFEQTRAYAETGADPHITQMRQYEIGAFYRQTGDVARAFGAADELIAMGAAHADSRARAFGWWLRASISAMIEDYDATLAEATESLRHSLPGTMDHSTASIFRTGALLMTGDRSVTADYLEEFAEQRRANGDSTVAIIASFYAAVAHFMRGRIRAGIARLTATDDLVRHGAERGLVQTYLIKKAEFYLTVAGDLPNPVAPDLPGLRDLPAAIGLRLSARRRAAQALSELKTCVATSYGFHTARLDMLEGIMARAAGQKNRAAELIATALAEFERQDLGNFRQLALAAGPKSNPRSGPPKEPASETRQ